MLYYLFINRPPEELSNVQRVPLKQWSEYTINFEMKWIKIVIHFFTTYLCNDIYLSAFLCWTHWSDRRELTSLQLHWVPLCTGLHQRVGLGFHWRWSAVMDRSSLTAISLLLPLHTKLLTKTCTLHRIPVHYTAVQNL